MTHRQVRKLPQVALSGRDDNSNILHVDMDAFYASVEIRDRPELKGKPIIIGHNAGRGVVTSATYQAREFGVHAAMSMVQALRLCPSAIVIEPNHYKYAEVSERIREIFFDFTPLVEPLALDEAFLDVSGAKKIFSSPTFIAQAIRERVEKELKITCSVGIAPNKFVAKLASTMAKPDGYLVVAPEEILDFLHPLPIGALWGVGGKTEAELNRLGLKTIKQVAQTPLRTLKTAIGESLGEHLHQLSWGKDDRTVEIWEAEKSIGNEETFSQDLDENEDILREILRLSEKVGSRVRGAHLVAKTVVLKVRFANFSTITRSKTLPHPTNSKREIYKTASDLFKALKLTGVKIRLVGVRAENLMPIAGSSQQLSLDGAEESWKQIENAADRASERFGPEAVQPARLIGE
jgi:DNA polymerase IV